MVKEEDFCQDKLSDIPRYTKRFVILLKLQILANDAIEFEEFEVLIEYTTMMSLWKAPKISEFEEFEDLID